MSSTSRHTASRIGASGVPLPIISRIRFSPASKASAHLRSCMSAVVPYHLTRFPCSSYNGTARNKNQRYSPSNRRRRASVSPGFPDANIARQTVQQAVKIFRTDGSLPPPALCLLKGEARVIEPALVQEIAGAVGQSRPDQRGNGINREWKLLFVLSDALFRCLNVCTQMTIFHDAIVSEAGPPARSAGLGLLLSVIGTRTERVMPLVAGGGSGETCRLLAHTLRGLAEQVKQNGHFGANLLDEWICLLNVCGAHRLFSSEPVAHSRSHRVLKMILPIDFRFSSSR